MNMKLRVFILSIVASLVGCHPVPAATVRGKLTDSFGVGYSPKMIVYPNPKYGVQADGTNTIMAIPRSITPTNGVFVFSNRPGHYIADSGTPNRTIAFWVQTNSDGQTFDFNYCAGLEQSLTFNQNPVLLSTNIIPMLITNGNSEDFTNRGDTYFYGNVFACNGTNVSMFARTDGGIIGLTYPDSTRMTYWNTSTGAAELWDDNGNVIADGRGVIGAGMDGSGILGVNASTLNGIQPFTVVTNGGSFRGSVTATNGLNVTNSAWWCGVTNGPFVWFSCSTNNTPTLVAPNGSQAWLTNGMVYVVSNGVWSRRW
jgi:hypothetical protein